MKNVECERKKKRITVQKSLGGHGLHKLRRECWSLNETLLSSYQ